jgi:DNA-binding NarL/FixJ family response regulator
MGVQIVMDAQMLHIDGIALLHRLKDEFPLLRIILLTTFSTDDSPLAALLAGVDVCLPKDISPAVSHSRRSRQAG